MSFQIAPFPTLTEDLLKRVGFSAEEFEFYYSENGEDHVLSLEASDENAKSISTMRLTDEECHWHPETHNMLLKRTISLRNPAFLFGQKGIAPETAELGIALRWYSKDSNQRGIFCADRFTRDAQGVDFTFKGKAGKGIIKGTVFLETILFLGKAGDSGGTVHATKVGTVLGVLDTCKLILDGNGSVFPIVEVEEPGKPLWYVNCSWTDPLEDLFNEDNVVVCINKKHSHYPLLNMEDGMKKSPFLTEVIAGAMQTIVQKVVDDDSWESIKQGKGFVSGSIGQAVSYFVTTFNWDTDSPEGLARSIRKYFDDVM